jgi:hypothetical protein
MGPGGEGGDRAYVKDWERGERGQEERERKSEMAEMTTPKMVPYRMGRIDFQQGDGRQQDLAAASSARSRRRGSHLN